MKDIANFFLKVCKSYSCVIESGNFATNLKLSGVIEADLFVMKRLGGL